jgi:hypothetical protein
MGKNTTKNTSVSIEASRPDQRLSVNDQDRRNSEIIQIDIENNFNTNTENDGSKIDRYIFSDF